MDKIFLRDASIMKHANEKSYVDDIKRTSKAFDLCLKHNLSIQITINKTYFLKNSKKFDNILKKKSNYSPKITIHLTAFYDDLFSKDLRTKQFVSKLNILTRKYKNIIGICVHPDHLNSWLYLKDLKKKDTYLAIEVTDKKARYGNKISHIKKIIQKNPYLKIVLDTSHIKELESINQLKFKKFFKLFSKYIVEAQISDFGNFYKNKKINTTHSLLFLNKDKNIKKQIKVLYNENNEINWVLEGLLPYGAKEKKYLKNEVAYVKKILS